jgi:hypothetical protein
MRHNSNFVVQPPIIPFERVPAHIRKRLGLPIVTRDGRLTCRCPDSSQLHLQAGHARR